MRRFGASPIADHGLERRIKNKRIGHRDVTLRGSDPVSEYRLDRYHKGKEKRKRSPTYVRGVPEMIILRKRKRSDGRLKSKQSTGTRIDWDELQSFSFE